MTPLKDPLPSRHEDAAALLPWFANGTLATGERARVQAHLEQCAACRADLDAQRALASRVAAAPVPERSPEQALSRLRGRLEPPAAAPGPPTPVLPARAGTAPPPRHRRFGRSQVVPMALAAGLLLAILPLARHLLGPTETPDFRTLSDRPVSGPEMQGDLRLVFDPGVDPARIDALLDAVGGRPVEPPAEGGVFTIRLAGAGAGTRDRTAAIAYLRQQEGVLFVEPIQPAGRP